MAGPESHTTDVALDDLRSPSPGHHHNGNDEPPVYAVNDPTPPATVPSPPPTVPSPAATVQTGPPINRWVRRLASYAKLSIFINILPTLIAVGYGATLSTKLGHDKDGAKCHNEFLHDDKGKDSLFYVDFGRFHKQCDELYTLGVFLIVTGIVAILRLFMLNLKSRKPGNPRPANHTGADYRSPAAIYAFQALFSLVTLVLYLYATVTLGRHPIITGHPSNGSAKSKYSAGLAFICLGFILSLYEVVAYGIASVYHLRYKAPVEPEANGGDSKAPTIVA